MLNLFKAAEGELTYNIMMSSYGLRKDKKSLTKCWGENGGFMETKLLSEKVILLRILSFNF